MTARHDVMAHAATRTPQQARRERVSARAVAHGRRKGQNVPEDAKPALKQHFLERFAETGIVQRGCEAIGVSRAALYEWRMGDPDFADAWREVEEGFTDELEATSLEIVRAVSPENPTNAHARLLEFLLKSRRRNVYGDRQEIDVRRVSVEVHVDTSEERARALAQILADTGAAPAAGMLEPPG